MKAVYAPDIPIPSDADQRNTDPWIAAARSAAGICRNDIDAHYRRQHGLLDQKIQEEVQKKEQGLYSQRQKTVLYVACEVVLGLAIAIGLLVVSISALATRNDIGVGIGILGVFIAIGIVVAVGIAAFWTWQRRSASRETLSGSYDFAIHSLRKRKEELRPLAECIVGKTWWALQIVPHSNHAALLLDLARSAKDAPVFLVTEPSRKNPNPAPAGSKNNPSDPFTGLLNGFDRFTSEAKDWAVISVPLPVIFKNLPMAENIAREIAALLSAQPVQSVANDFLILHSDGSFVSLESGHNPHIAIWQKCCQNAAGWRAHFKRLNEQAQKTIVEAMELMRQNTEDWLKAEPLSAQPNSIWANLSEQRPDIKGLSNDLRKELEHLTLELGGGIDHAQRQGLLAELRKAMDQAHLRPWSEQWTRHISDLDQRTGEILSQINAVSSEIKELSGAVYQLSSQLNSVGNLKPDAQLGQVNTSLQHIGTGIDRLRSSSGTAPSVEHVQQLAASLSRATMEMNSIQGWLSNLNQSSRFAANQLADYEQRINQILSKMAPLYEQMMRIIALVEDDQKQRSATIAEYENRLRMIEDEYARQVKDAQARALASKIALEGTQKTIAWLAYQPEALVSELTGIDKRSIEDLGSVPASNVFLDTIYERIQATLEKGCQPVSDLCSQRIQHIDVAYQMAQQALKVNAGQAKDAEIILFPVWYIEWCETEDSGEQKMHYYLTTPIRQTSSTEGNQQVIPLYPAVTQYMRSVSPGIWSGTYSLGQLPPLVKSLYTSVKLYKVQL